MKKSRKSEIISDAERDWIQDRVYTLIEDIIKTSNDERAAEIRQFLSVLEGKGK